MLLTLLLVAGLAVVVPAGYLHYAWAAVAGVTAVVLVISFGDLLTGLMIWLVTVACFSYFFWKLELPFFFNLTIDRIVLPVLLFSAVGMMIIGTLQWRRLWPISALMLLMVMYFGISLAVTGFDSVTVVTPHFRLIGGYCFPFVAFALAVLAIRNQRQIGKVAVFFCLFGLYLTVTAWAEYLNIWSIVFPRYIADSQLGIHWGRSRGPFLVSASLGITLVYVFYSNAFLARRVGGLLRAAIYFIQPFTLAAIFFTQTRSVWLATIVGAVIWLLGAGPRRSRVATVIVLVAAMSLTTAVFWTGISSQQREKGGVADLDPIRARVGLARITYQMFKDHPVVGVGFGHFRDYADRYHSDPADKYLSLSSQLMEHNNFLSILAESGLVGLVLYLWLLGILFTRSLQLFRRLPDGGRMWLGRDFVILYWILFADFVIDGMFRETSVDPFNNGLFYLISGLMLGAGYLLDRQQSQPPVAEAILEQNQS